MKSFVAIALALLVSTPVLAETERSASERAAFVAAHPAPAGCVKCEVDHKVALMNGGADSRHNMQWLSDSDHKVKTRQDWATHNHGYSHSSGHRGGGRGK